MSKSYKIYLDVCCLNRTLDNLEQVRIRMEAEAVTEIIQNCENGKWTLIIRKAKQYQNLLSIEVENPTIWLMKILQVEEENNETDGN